ncbi:hypothetical protein GYMLUDRAFT_264981 [Collybiopsis luxurians FD-317 M1]|uniref:Indoleamine 2,3-dioxygenase n=1 Tax=Collybiopsis luxurians FD-317 M1 TaxID=944289 RepID=A0A0D0C718_9AGAR|nr:hypothetical protein GYMLUDRAFT_264981 [Collybiopsis luxurians FD-317 M1]
MDSQQPGTKKRVGGVNDTEEVLKNSTASETASSRLVNSEQGSTQKQSSPPMESHIKAKRRYISFFISNMNFGKLLSFFTSLGRAERSNSLSQLDFDINPITGFVPSEPLPRLSSEFKLWEEMLAEASDVLKLGDNNSEEALALKTKGDGWRANIRSIPVLDIQSLKFRPRHLQRVHVVLTWLVQYYVHSLPPSIEAKQVPASLAVPLVDVSRMLGIAPVITFSDTVIWNWELICPENPVTIDNMAVVHTFSGSEDEQHFYLVQAAIELHGVQILHIIEEYTQISDLDEPTISKIAGDLARLTMTVEEISDLIQSIRTGCDPQVFNWEMQPWYNGNDAKGEGDPGWIYDGVDPTSPELKHLSGPSGGQSPVMQALDIFLGIDHGLEKEYSTDGDDKPADHGFMDRMRFHMLGNHRAYLEHLKKLPRSVRDLAACIPALHKPYNDAIAALKNLRRLHMRIAVMYNVNVSRTTSVQSNHPDIEVAESRHEPGSEYVTKNNRDENREPVRGSGGGDVIRLLRAGVDATSRATLRDPLVSI